MWRSRPLMRPALNVRSRPLSSKPPCGVWMGSPYSPALWYAWRRWAQSTGWPWDRPPQTWMEWWSSPLGRQTAELSFGCWVSSWCRAFLFSFFFFCKIWAFYLLLNMFTLSVSHRKAYTVYPCTCNVHKRLLRWMVSSYQSAALMQHDFKSCLKHVKRISWAYEKETKEILSYIDCHTANIKK